MKPDLKREFLREGRGNGAESDRRLSGGKGKGMGRFESEFERMGLREERVRREGTRSDRENGTITSEDHYSTARSELEVQGNVVGIGRQNGAVSDGELLGGKATFEFEVQEKEIIGKSGVLSDEPIAGCKERGGFVCGKDSGEKEDIVGIKEGGSVEVVSAGVASGRGRVRRATFADLDAIMDINDNVYDGTDYIPAYFHIFMQSKQYAIYVYEIDGKLMALRTFHFLPDVDDLVTIMAIRVRPSFQGRGFGRPVRNPIMDQFRKDYPQVTRYIIQTLFKPHVRPRIEQWKLLYHWTELKYQLPHSQLVKRFASLRQHTNQRTIPRRLSYSDCCDWLNSSDKLVKFLATYVDDYIVAGAVWTSVKLDSFELRNVLATNNVFASFGGSKGRQSDGNMVIFPQGTGDISDSEIAGFSISSLFQCKYGVNFEIHFYGDSEVDLLSHIYSHMLHYVSVTQDDVRLICSLHFPLSIDSNRVRENLREEFGEIFRSEYFSVTEAVQYLAPLNR